MSYDITKPHLQKAPEPDATAPVTESDHTICDYLQGRLNDRKSVGQYLKDRQRKALLDRLPAFEADTLYELDELRQELNVLAFRNWITNMLLVGAILIFIFLHLAKSLA